MTQKPRTRAMFCDFLNLPRGKYVPAKIASGGKIGFAQAVFGVTFDRDLIPVPGSGMFDGIPDVDLILDTERRKSWQPGTEIALGDLHTHGTPFGLCGRGALKRAIAMWQEHGLTPMVGIELEAYVFAKDDQGNWEPYDTPGAFVYGCGPSNDPAGLMDVLWDTAAACDLPLESMNGEYDNGQFELTLGFADALKACDDAFLFRAMAKELAAQRGLLLSFMPKPIAERGGSGMHVNFSFTDKAGKNVIAPDGDLSTVAKQALAGMLAHHEGLAGLLATTVNSYDRLTPASMAGYWANWAEDHRLVTLRSTTTSPRSARLEHRTADCATNPYIAVAAILQAALNGVSEGMDLQEAEDMDGLENTRATRHAPASLGEALTALEADTALCDGVGRELCEGLIFLKRDEIERLEGKSADEVRDFYLPFV